MRIAGLFFLRFSLGLESAERNEHVTFWALSVPRVQDSNLRGCYPSSFPARRHRPLGELSKAAGAGFEPADDYASAA